MRVCTDCDHYRPGGGCDVWLHRRHFEEEANVCQTYTRKAQMETEFIKADKDKNRLELLPFAALEEVGKVLTFGAKKYKDHNWRRCDKPSRYVGAALRHLFAWSKGEDNDPETGLSHIAHASCCCLFLLGLIMDGKAPDDRDRFPVQEESKQINQLASSR